MSMTRKIFKPGAGQKVARYVAAYVNGTGVYRGDLVCWDTTAPTSQGSSGVLAGQTLGANDFIFVAAPAATTFSQGRQAGVVEGTHIGDRNQTTAITNDTIAIVQTWGIHDNVFSDATATDAGMILYVGSTTGGVTPALVTATIGAATDIKWGNVNSMVGVNMVAWTGTHTRGTVATENGGCAFIRCDF